MVNFYSLLRELCVLLNPEDCYRMFSEIISNEKDSEFAISIVDILNTILLTSSELFDLRTSLKNFDTNVKILKIEKCREFIFFNHENLRLKESYSLFVCLYKTWCHNPIATVALCLLSQNYEHAYNLVNLLYVKPIFRH